MSEVLYEKIISENELKNSQLRLVVNVFRDEYYLHLRRYYQDYEGNWVATKEGASMPYNIASVIALLDGLIDVVSNEESIHAITVHFEKKLDELTKNRETYQATGNE